MKVKELNKDVLNWYYNKNKKLIVEQEGDNIYISDLYRIYIIDEKDFILNINKKEYGLSNFIKEINNVIDYYKKADIEININGKEYYKLKSEDNECLVNARFFRYFDNYVVKIKDKKSPVLVYENNMLVGFILPIEF